VTRREDDDAQPGTPEGAGPAAGNGGTSKSDEPHGLTGVDAAPLPPLTREEVEALRRENEELREQLLRRRAEFDNYRKRVERDREQSGQEAAASIFRTLVPTLDNLDRALEAGGDEATLRTGVELIRRELTALLEAQGVVIENPLGQRFDPKAHQAVSHEPAPGHAEGTVVEVLGKGYSFKGRLLRPALVKVAKADEPGGGIDPEAVH
jgi:molecular chaperone GrpE